MPTYDLKLGPTPAFIRQSKVMRVLFVGMAAGLLLLLLSGVMTKVIIPHRWSSWSLYDSALLGAGTFVVAGVSFIQFFFRTQADVLRITPDGFVLQRVGGQVLRTVRWRDPELKLTLGYRVGWESLGDTRGKVLTHVLRGLFPAGTFLTPEAYSAIIAEVKRNGLHMVESLRPGVTPGWMQVTVRSG